MGEARRKRAKLSSDFKFHFQVHVMMVEEAATNFGDDGKMAVWEVLNRAARHDIVCVRCECEFELDRRPYGIVWQEWLKGPGEQSIVAGVCEGCMPYGEEILRYVMDKFHAKAKPGEFMETRIPPDSKGHA